MRALATVAALLAAACTPPAQEAAPATQASALQDGAGNRIEALTAQAQAHCSADGVWCVEVANDTATARRDGAQVVSMPLETGATHAAWPFIVLGDGEAIIGVTRTVEQMYSGGSASATHVTLYDISGADPVAVLTAPLSGSASIRACYDVEDEAARQQACHDEYEFNGDLALDPGVTDGAPRLVLTTEATTFPGRRSRDSDSTQEAPLQPGDLQYVRDDTCSYTRVASREGGAYVWDEPLPPCTDYLEP